MSEQDFMKAEVRVFCPTCKDGHNAIWSGSLIDWGLQMGKEAKHSKDIPEWAQYAFRHEAHHGHMIMVKYPDGKIIPLFGGI